MNFVKIIGKCSCKFAEYIRDIDEHNRISMEPLTCRRCHLEISFLMSKDDLEEYEKYKVLNNA